jgi:transposase
MPIVAESFSHVIGVDTHARQHAYAIVEAANGRLLEEQSFPTSPNGISRALAWMRRRAGASVAVAVEGSGSYGATLSRALEQVGVAVFEVRPPARGSRARDGKTDRFDAVAAARGILHADITRLATPRAEGVRSALHVRATARRAMKSEANRDRQRLIALLRAHRLGIDARAKIADATVDQIAAWRPRPTDALEIAVARDEAIRLARRIVVLRAEMDENERQLQRLVVALEPTLLEMPGVGPVSAATILDVFSHRGRIRSEAAFAKMGGIAPQPVFSGNSGRHRLSRTGDRALNEPIWRIVDSRRRFHQPTIDYIQRRTTEGKAEKDILRCLKRYVTRAIYRHLNTVMA